MLVLVMVMVVSTCFRGCQIMGQSEIVWLGEKMVPRTRDEEISALMLRADENLKV